MASKFNGEPSPLYLYFSRKRHQQLARLGRRSWRDLAQLVDVNGKRTTQPIHSVGGKLFERIASAMGFGDVVAFGPVMAGFIVNGPSPADDFSAMTEADFARRADEFRLLPGETLAGVLAHYAEVAERTDDLVRTPPDLDLAHPLPAAPWFPPGTKWTARRALMHVVAETAQHAGHADIIREALDGAKSMG